MPATVQRSLDFEAPARASEAARAALRGLPVSREAIEFLLALHGLAGTAAIQCPLRRICDEAGISEAAGRAAVIELAYGTPFLVFKIDPGRANEYAINWQEVFSA